MKLFDELKSARFIAIARRVPADRIVKCARAVAEAGGTFLEITFDASDPDTLSDTAAKLTAVRRELPNLHLGCGTVLSVEMADAAARAGAEFLVAPNTNIKVIDRAHEHELPMIPGALTPTEIAAAYEAGADLVKIFPVAPGDEGYVKNVMSPLSHIPFIVTGGVNPDTIKSMLATGAVAVAAGATVLRADLVAEGNYTEITALARKHLENM